MEEIKIVPAYDRGEVVRELFQEYTAMLVEEDPEFGKYLQKQNFDGEMAHLEMKYGMPYGRLYLLYVDGEPAGCIGMRKLDEENCEMKRLYIRAGYRGRNLGEKLVKRLLEDAREIGYRHMLLDTLPFLKTAISIYKRMGFYEIESYNGSPMEGLVYLKMDL